MANEQLGQPTNIEASVTEDNEKSEGLDPMHPDFYSNSGFVYNYELGPKLPEHLDEYFSMPVVRAFIDQMRAKPNLFKRLTAGRFGNPKLSKKDLPSRILDLGSGVGAESNVLRNILPDSQIFSLDISTIGSQTGKEVFDLNQVQADINDPPFAQNSFHGIHCKDVFVHVADKEKFFANVARMLALNGSLLLVSADEAFESISQFEWQLQETIEIAAKYGLKLITKDNQSFVVDDWYESGQNRVYLLFKKVK